MNSKHIVDILYKKHRKDFSLEQVKTGSTWGNSNLFQLDMWVMKLSWKLHTIGYEIKVSRGDFLSDTKWPNYLNYCNQFSWVCPDGLIGRDEVDPQVGLIYIKEDGSIRTVKRATFRKVNIPADLYRYIIMWRLYSRPIKEKSNREIIEEYLENKKNNVELANRFKSKLIKENARLELDYNRLKFRTESWNELMRKYSAREITNKLKEDKGRLNVDVLEKLKSIIEREIQLANQ